jgi:hypothetical protein
VADAHKNFAFSTVASAPAPAGSGLSLDVAAGDGTKFPTPPFNATVWPVGAQPTTSNAEIVRVTLIVGDTLTIARTQESTAARTILVGDQIAANITAKTLTDVENVKLFQNEYVSSEDETVRANSQVILEDYYELGSGFATELVATGLLALGTDVDETFGFTSGADQYGGFLEILTTA